MASGTPAGSIEALVRDGTRVLSRSGIENARRDARLLAAEALGKSAEELIAQRHADIDSERRTAFERLIGRRAQGEPVSRILGRRAFWSLDLRIGPAVLDPRPDSETLVETALRLTGEQSGERTGSRAAPLRILDLGTGSGCLLLALLAECPRATGIGIDRSIDAALTARANALACSMAGRAHFAAADWASAVTGPFDLIVSNPPYIASAALEGLDREVRCFDPALALDGGADGLAAYRAIVPDLPRLLSPHGWAVLEIGWDQAAAVEGIVGEAGLGRTQLTHDLAGRPRCLAAGPA